MNPHRPIPEIPDHEVIRKIGSGAYGEVWLARAITGAWRAIKIVRREDFDDDRSFQREFEGIRHYEPIARNHPGLVHILHVGTSKGESPFYYYVMELGDDVKSASSIHPETYTPRTLQTDKKLSLGTPLPVKYVLEIGLQLSDALAYLHSQELTHRDIKPANIIFVHNLPKLADVGLVAQRDQRTFVGTEGFIPHEGPGTKRADVYALGKVLYELATGRDRLDFPELPDELPDGDDRERWLSLNHIICAVCEPQLERCSIDSATKLYKALKDVKKGKPFSCPRSGLFSSPGKTMAALSGIALTFTAVLVALFFWFPDNKDAVPQPDPGELKQGSMVISSEPLGASIYDRDGHYIDETPYGPITLPVGTEVSYTLKKPGYRNMTVKGVIRADIPLGIGGRLTPFTPPVKGQPWSDSEGAVYMDPSGVHISNAPIAAESVKKFFLEKKQQTPELRTFTVSLPPENTPVDYVLLRPGQALEYAEWLTEESHKKGLLSDKQGITPIPVREWKNWTLNEEDKKARLSAFKLQAGEIDYVNAKINSTPEGAVVTLNGQELGKTPINWPKLSPGHYSLSFKLPGYERQEMSGLVQKNKDLVVNCTLKKDGSVEFNKEWKNSLSMTFSPVSPTLSAAKFETTRADFLNYIQDQQKEPPLETDFKQELDHPVVNITREDARKFAEWLTRKEQKEELIEATDYYRLPTDAEWTELAGGLPEAGKYPSERHTASLTPEMGAESASDLFPWGNTWPPPSNSGNFADSSLEKTLKNRSIPHYSDLYKNTSPTGKFTPNKLGLYDITGNVWEWVEDNYGGLPEFKFKDYEVARGGSWTTYKPHQLLTRYRIFLAPDTKASDVGFRLVLVRQMPQKTDTAPAEGTPPQTDDHSKESAQPDATSPEQTPEPYHLTPTFPFQLPPALQNITVKRKKSS